ncbi:hypothetical protein AB5N19_12437 [Seiridium cardinale]
MRILDNDDLVLPKGSLVLVTGASGFIASNLIVEGLETGYRIRGVAQPPSKVQKTHEIFNSPHYDAVIILEMEPEGALMNPNPEEAVPPVIKGATSILRSALKEPKIQRFVFTSSSTATSLPTPGVRFKIDNTTWNTEVDDYMDFPSPYKPDNAFQVYSASKPKRGRQYGTS